MNPNVSIIILNWNGWQDTLECLESLFQIKYDNYNVIIVDNNSEDNSISKIKEYCEGNLKIKSQYVNYDTSNKPIELFEFNEEKLDEIEEIKIPDLPINQKIILIELGMNYGFAGGNNFGIKFALKFLDPHYILLLNNDTVVDSQFLEILVKEAQNPNIGILGPNVYYYDDPERITYIGGNISCYTGKITHPYFNEIKQMFNVSEIDYISGCSLLIKKDVIEAFGLMDTNYFLYYEDTDWCLNAKKNGIKIVHVPEAEIWHKVSASINTSNTALYYGTRNLYLLIRKNCPKNAMITFLPIFIIKKFLNSIIKLFQGKTSESKAILTAFKDIIKGKYGFKELK